MSHYSDKNHTGGYLIIALFLLLMNPAFAQLDTKQNKKLFFKADKAFDFGDYLNALTIYRQLYAVDSTNNELNYKLGICCYEIRKHRKEALKYFQKTSASDFPETNYYLGRLYHLNRDYERAISAFTQYKYLSTGEEHSIKETDDLIAKSNTAMLMESNADKTLQIKNLGSTVNTEYAEYAPLIPAEENFLIFTSRRSNRLWTGKDPLGDFFEDVYMSKKKDSVWLNPEVLDTAINTALHDACTGLSADGESMLLYRTSEDLMGGDIYESFYVNQKWTKPKMLGKIVNDPDYLETSACYSKDGNLIFFSSNRPGGYGGKDLYCVKKLPNGSWGQPLNLGPSINTAYNEDAPFIHPAENILFFSSEGHTNMGGYDVFKSLFDETGRFETPANLGSPVNTVDDDIFFVLNTDASVGYLSSEREGGYGSQDIYSVYFPDNNIPLNVYNVHVFDESGALINDVEMVVTNMEKRTVHGIYLSNKRTGKIMIISPPQITYRVAIQASGFEPFITNVLFTAENELIFKLARQK